MDLRAARAWRERTRDRGRQHCVSGGGDGRGAISKPLRCVAVAHIGARAGDARNSRPLAGRCGRVGQRDELLQPVHGTRQYDGPALDERAFALDARRPADRHDVHRPLRRRGAAAAPGGTARAGAAMGAQAPGAWIGEASKASARCSRCPSSPISARTSTWTPACTKRSARPYFSAIGNCWGPPPESRSRRTTWRSTSPAVSSLRCAAGTAYCEASIMFAGTAAHACLPKARANATRCAAHIIIGSTIRAAHCARLPGLARTRASNWTTGRSGRPSCPSGAACCSSASTRRRA